MELELTPEQESIRDSIGRFLNQRANPQDRRRLIDTETGFDREVWRELASSIGLHGLIIPERLGGSGMGIPELCAAFGEIGRVLLGGPYLATIGASAPLIISCTTQAYQSEMLPRIADGSAVVTVAGAANSAQGASQPPLVATRCGPGYSLSGAVPAVLEGMIAETILVVARHEQGVGLFAVAASCDGLQRESLDMIDLTRRFARMTFNRTPARLVSGDGDAATAIAVGIQTAAVVHAAEQIGAAQQCLDMAVAHSKLRLQFGKPIGAFQAVKHRCAEMTAKIESARLGFYYAAWAAEKAHDELAIASAVARVACQDALAFAAAQNIQIHGGMAFTWDYDAQLYFRRAKADQFIFGTPRQERERLTSLALARTAQAGG
ncbi:MAG: acyl-CoA dehydrogenase family protein [Burkholderiaceae bacterium]|nr:acyl-CoA dehydrogenase family protein [Desulfobacterales bacterium]MDP3139636.1 acyl-CoA dehydrogenase family protein [Burkholderiaceae bacterium]